MVRRSSRLSGLNGAMLRPENRLDVVPVSAPAGAVADVQDVPSLHVKKRRCPYHLVVSMVAPDQAMIDLFEGNRWMYTVSKVESTDLPETELDVMGRIHPNAVWHALEKARESLGETPAKDACLPSRSDVFGARYEDYSAHPR